MTRVRTFMLVSALPCLAGCPTKDKYETLPTVRITAPTADRTYTNGTVHITAAIDPPLDLPIELRRDGAAFTTLMPPGYDYSWDTTKAVEASYVLTAEVAFSSGTATSVPLTIVVDRTPPTLSRTPSPGAGDIMLRAPIQVTFSEPIVLSRSAEATFTLSSNGAIVPTDVTLDSQGQTATIGIADPGALALPATLVGTITGSITDRAGNLVDVPSNDWFWDVPMFVKLPPSPVDPNIPAATRLPAFALGSDLKPFVATASRVPSGTGLDWQIQVSQYDGDEWNLLGPLSDDIDSASRGVALAVGGEQPFVAWHPSGPDPGEIAVASWNGSAWDTQPSVPLPSADAGAILTPILRIARDLRPIILWSTGDRYFIAGRTRTGWAQDFGIIPIASLLPFDGNHFDMILDDADNPIVSWINPNGTGHVATWAGGAWTAAPDALRVDEAFMALDSRRRPMQVVSGGSGALLVQQLTDDNEWQLASVATVPPQVKYPRVAAGPSGLPVVAYFDAQTTSVGMARWTGQRWDTRAFAFGPNSIDEAPRIVVDRNGTAWIGWRDTANQFNVWAPNY